MIQPDFPAKQTSLHARPVEFGRLRESQIDANNALRTPDAAPAYARLNDELAKISERLGGIQRQINPVFDEAKSAGFSDALTVRSMIAARRRRSRFFSSELFADPAWDILLDLFHSELEQRRTTVSSLCVAACVPATTALRWIKTLTDAGLLSRRADPFDGRRIYVELTGKASQAMQAFISETGARE